MTVYEGVVCWLIFNQLVVILLTERAIQRGKL